MKMIKSTIVAAALFVTASAAQAVTLFHVVNGSPGTATINSSGGCKVNATYENAVYGAVYNASDVLVGQGIVAADGHVIAMTNYANKISSVYDAVKDKQIDVYYMDMATTQTAAEIETAAGCTVAAFLISKASSRYIRVYDVSSNLDSATIKFGFNGFTPLVMKTKGSKTYYVQKPFAGVLTFKGKKPTIT